MFHLVSSNIASFLVFTVGALFVLQKDWIFRGTTIWTLEFAIVVVLVVVVDLVVVLHLILILLIVILLLIIIIMRSMSLMSS